jgi:tRNA pseudouridine38-40 synthase
VRFFKATIEYDGTDFAGFQWQNEVRTVQGTLEAALQERTEQIVRITGAGRTDAGVHALGQVVSFQAETRIPIEKMALALNSVLPSDLTVRAVEEVDERFNARFSASARTYVYLILNRRTPSALWGRYSAFYPEPLDVERMREAARLLIGEHDFAAFNNEREPGKATYREVTHCQLRRVQNFVMVRIRANAFLRGMVRSIVGTLTEVGKGKRSPQTISELLHSGDRREAGPSAPPQGLCLIRVEYGQRKQYLRHEEIDEEPTQ